LLAAAEKVAGAAKWEVLVTQVNAFAQATEVHFRLEEEGLFPALDSAAPGAAGPTSVMRMEHQQECLGLMETLHLLIQQHNAKEEAILYPLADRTLGERSDALLGERGAA
jgi:iron-sulfur cluster repair protein YtfE (RIC family)